MKEFIASKRFKILLCIFALLFGLMLYAAMSLDVENIPQTVLQTITKPFVNIATSISSWVDNTLDMLINADKYKKDNEVLKSQLSEMYASIMDKEALEKENNSLREMLGIIEENDSFSLSPPCSVIALEAMSIAGNFTISRGSGSGIKKGDPVITDVGLVGIVSVIAPTYARITTILSAEINVGVVTVSGGVVGIIENDILYSADGFALMKYIVNGSDIKTGDVIVTSGGNVYPAGLIVGTVTEVFPDENGLSLNAIIEPSEDVFKVTDVFVITSFNGQGVTP